VELRVVAELVQLSRSIEARVAVLERVHLPEHELLREIGQIGVDRADERRGRAAQRGVLAADDVDLELPASVVPRRAVCDSLRRSRARVGHARVRVRRRTERTIDTQQRRHHGERQCEQESADH